MKYFTLCLLCFLFLTANPVLASLTDNGNGTVTDSETGLTWQQSVNSTTKSWQEALAACANLTLGGQSDWRLPNRNELQSIVDYRYSDPALDTNFFPATSDTFWTSTTIVDSPSYAYTVDFNSGAVGFNDKATSQLSVRAVRGGAAFVPPSSFFYNNGNGTVTDSRTGLVWRQVPLDGDNDGTADALNWQEALAAATQLNFAGQTDWRLPNRNELQSIVDYRYADPAIDTNIFPKVTSSAFWTSTTVADSPSYAYTLNFISGEVGCIDKASNQLSMLAVRGRATISTGLFKFFDIPEKVTANTPFAVEVIANDSAFNGTVNLNISDGGGVSPQSVTLENGRWKGEIAITRSGKTSLIASYSPLNGDRLFGSSEWFEVADDQSINADLQVTIEKKKELYNQGDTLDYRIYVSNRGKNAASSVNIDIVFTGGFEITSSSCSVDGATCNKLSADIQTAKYKASIPSGEYAYIRVHGQATIGSYYYVKLVAEAHDTFVTDPIQDNNRELSVIRTDIPNLPGEQTAELLPLPPVSSDPANLDTVVLTHGLQGGSCDASELWSGSKSNPAQAGYLIQQKGLHFNIYQFFWKGACQGTGITKNAYIAAQQNVYFAAQQLAKKLYDKLGPDYDKKMHFIGHSLGTAVNAYAANIFLRKENNINKAQVTILDHPNHIGKIAGFIFDKAAEKQWGFDENFFANTLPFDRAGLSLYVDNYYSAFSSNNKLLSTGVGSKIKGPKVFNHDALISPFQVGHKLLPNESFVDNDHSGVHQWYRWTMRPNEENNFVGETVCNNDGTWNHNPGYWLGVNWYGLHSSLNPCPEQRGGWRESILLQDTIDFPAFNGGEKDKINNSTVTPSSNTQHGCGVLNSSSLLSVLCIEGSTTSAVSARASQILAAAEEPQIPKSSIEFIVTVPNFLRYLSFDYSFPNIGDGDYVYIFLDGVPVWKMGGDGLTAGETVSSGLIPVRAEAGQKKLIVALYGVGEQNAQFSLDNFKFTTVADTDNDGVADDEDAFPNDPSEWLDTDNDGIGNNADLDDDNDGVADSEDAFPLDPSEWSDTDGDGIGNNADLDDDNDGIADDEDAFPNDPSEWLDTDNDGIGNNADLDDDNDGVADSEDAFPLDPSEWSDTDGDGIGDNADLDDDNDGIADTADNCPLVGNPNQEDENGYQDGDGIGDACEILPSPSKALPAVLQLLLGN